jgi:hypothetical protein
VKYTAIQTILLMVLSAFAVPQRVNSDGGIYSRSAVSIWGDSQRARYSVT